MDTIENGEEKNVYYIPVVLATLCDYGKPFYKLNY